MKKHFFIITVLATVFIAGCVRLGNSQPAAVAGIFKSFDQGENWGTKNLFLSSGGIGDIAGVGVVTLTFDPQDPRALYLASAAHGLLYSLDSADSWQQGGIIAEGRIGAVVIDPSDKCTVYAARNNTVIKTSDCTRTWSEVFIDTRADKTVTAIAIDHFDSLIIYAANTAGDILKSVDGGGNWRVIERLDNPVRKLLVDPNDSRILYAATERRGIFKTISAGADWFDINENLEKFSGALEFKNLLFDTTQPDALLLVAKYGLLRTFDGGTTWEAIALITPPTSTDIFATAISPFNNQEIYYATRSTFYKTTDGGQNWVTLRLPSAATPSVLIVDPVNPGILYMGLVNQPQ